MKIIKAPYFNKGFIKQKAEDFRREYWKQNRIPLDIEKIIEQNLKIEIIPIKELMNFCDTDALITSNWESIYIDEKGYFDDRFYPRLRFSLAHEIGHFVLHNEIYSQFEIDELTDFYKFIEKIETAQYGIFEYQANQFVSYLLVPRDKLKLLVEEEKNRPNGKFDEYRKGLGEEFIIEYLSYLLSDKFGVSKEVIKIALNNKQKEISKKEVMKIVIYAV